MIMGEITYENCRFTNNIGLIRYAKSFNRCYFTQNRGTDYQGFIYGADSFTNCDVISNKGGEWALIRYVKLVSDCNFKNNVIYGNGILYHASTVLNSRFENNEVKRIGTMHNPQYGMSGNGGAICDVDTVDGCTFINNKASMSGGAIEYAKIVKNSIFKNNNAWEGGAINYVKTVIGCDFQNNRATTEGGAISFVSVVKNSNFKNNYAKGKSQYSMFGGGAISTFGKVTIDKCNFISNTADTSGSAILINTAGENANVVISNCKFSKNKAKGNFNTMGYDFKNYANGIIYTLGFKHANIKFKNCKGLDAKNKEKFKKKLKLMQNQKRKS